MFNFDRQVDFFRKKINLPTEKYTDLWNEEHDWAFVVAGAANMELVADLREAVSKAIMDGTTLEEFRKDFRKIVKERGWTYKGKESWRTKTIYDTNMSSSYQAGRYEQLQEVKEYMPYWEYVHNAIKYPREDHQALDGKILPADDPWWHYYYPPNGYGCKCTVHAHNDKSLEDSGKILSKDNIVKYQKLELDDLGEIETPEGVHPSFHHIAGKNIKELESRTSLSRTEIVADLLLKRAESLDPKFAIKALDKVFSFQPAVDLLNKKSNNFINSTLENKKPNGKIINIGYFNEEIADNLALMDKSPNNVIISLKDDLILHATRNKKVNPISQEDWQDLPSKLRNAERVLFSPKSKKNAKDAVVYVLATKDSHKKLIVSLDYEIKIKNLAEDKGKPKKIKYINPIITGSYIKTKEEIKELFAEDNKYILFSDDKKIAED